jgi:thiamine-monophosphate kinase
MPTEQDFINWIRNSQPVRPSILLGIGDDLAVLRLQGEDLIFAGVDQILDGIHFDSAIHTPKQIGAKAMNRNLSDCAAMGCLPAAALVSAALPRDYTIEKAKQLYLGIRDAGDALDCPIVGGDTSTWDGKLVLSVTILGKASGIEPVTRRGAQAGDYIFVTGPLGGSIISRHINIRPRVSLGRQIAPLAHAMIDISDGLSRDLSQICRESNVGAVLRSDLIPIHPDARELSARDGVSPLEHALHDGEDYELLYTSSDESAPGIAIGQIVEEKGLWIESPDEPRKVLQPNGWEHQLAGEQKKPMIRR